MREQLKQRFRDMIDTLARGEELLYSGIREKDMNALHQLFEDMQNSAIAIGSTIDQVEGEGTETVRHLENYCELLWRYMTEDEVNGRFETAGQLASEREEMRACLDEEFPGRLEIVFLVGRRDAWKGMERFWSLMRDQADCYIVTAPCLEDEEDAELAGTAEVIGAEDAELAGTAEITGAEDAAGTVGVMRFDDYDFYERMPDLVFVDGPYEDSGEPGAAPGYDFLTVRENAGLVLYLPCHEDAGQVEEAHCGSLRARESDIILVSSEEICRAYVGIMGQMKGGRGLIRKLYVLDTLDKEALLKKGRDGIVKSKKKTK